MGFEEIPLADLADNDYNPRRQIDEDRIAELAQSIERVGLISPLTVRELDGDGEGDEDQGLTGIDAQIKAKITGDGHDGPTYEVVAGTRRLHALREIHGKTSDHEVPCQVVELPDDEAELVALAENLDRDDLTPTEEAEAFAERVFVTTDKATVEALDDVEVRMAGNNYTVPFAALVDGLDRNVLPAGHPLAFPAPKSSSVESVADDIASRTPVEIARRCKLYALPEEVWSLVDEGDLSLRKAEIIADLAAVEAPWTERVEEMIETARECVEEAWDRVTCREECGERKGRMAGDGEPSVHSQVAEAQDDAEEQVEETRERIEELTELAERLERGMEERFDGGLVGLDARRKYCYSCGQAVRKEDVEGVLERVRGMVGERSSDE